MSLVHLVGREVELTVLGQCLERARAGQRQVCSAVLLGKPSSISRRL